VPHHPREAKVQEERVEPVGVGRDELHELDAVEAYGVLFETGNWGGLMSFMAPHSLQLFQ
jgi:hypothetical protein